MRNERRNMLIRLPKLPSSGTVISIDQTLSTRSKRTHKSKKIKKSGDYLDATIFVSVCATSGQRRQPAGRSHTAGIHIFISLIQGLFSLGGLKATQAKADHWHSFYFFFLRFSLIMSDSEGSSAAEAQLKAAAATVAAAADAAEPEQRSELLTFIAHGRTLGSFGMRWTWTLVILNPRAGAQAARVPRRELPTHHTRVAAAWKPPVPPTTRARAYP